MSNWSSSVSCTQELCLKTDTMLLNSGIQACKSKLANVLITKPLCGSLQPLMYCEGKISAWAVGVLCILVQKASPLLEESCHSNAVLWLCNASPHMLSSTGLLGNARWPTVILCNPWPASVELRGCSAGSSTLAEREYGWNTISALSKTACYIYCFQGNPQLHPSCIIIRSYFAYPQFCCSSVKHRLCKILDTSRDSFSPFLLPSWSKSHTAVRTLVPKWWATDAVYAVVHSFVSHGPHGDGFQIPYRNCLRLETIFCTSWCKDDISWAEGI